MAGRTLYDKIWNSHVARDYGDGSALIYADRHLLHEVSTPQSFLAIEVKGHAVRRPDANLAVPDHSVPTRDRGSEIADPQARAQTARLAENVARHAIPFIPLSDARQGIVHVMGPEQGFTLPGMTLVCGDSHTSTHGAFGALAFGIGASECGIVMATQCLRQKKSKTMRVRIVGERGGWLSAKDIALALISEIGANGASGHAIEYAGPVVEAMTMAERMTLCNMAIETGARVGMVAPDGTTYAYLENRPMAPKGAMWDLALAHWKTLASDPEADFDRDMEFDVTGLAPYVTWGTSPEDALPITARVPDPAWASDASKRTRQTGALSYMGLEPGTPLIETPIDKVFIGSCTNGRLEDLRAAARVLKGRKVADGVELIIVPGSGLVRAQAEAEKLDRIFLEAGAEWRYAGCSLCVAMNGDRVAPGERCASTSNRNFEGRQGPGGRTHLMSPQMAAAAAVTGRLTDVRDLQELSS
ncbi:3-isopropylmalate dehydratase large subunit [Rhodobacterales bacterium]|nr:3-isopropylmalate dehydratase large subunit [Rhodobacterales bacterium]